MPLAEAFQAVVAAGPARVAVSDGGLVLSYYRLLEWSEAVARCFDRHHAAARRVALVLPNGPDFVSATLGAARVGGIVAPLNADYRPPELAHYLADIDASVVVVSPATAAHALEAVARLERRPCVVLSDGPLKLETLSAADGRRPPGTAGPDPPLILLYTSGTTGPPKRVIRTHRQLLAEVGALHRLLGVTPTDRVLGAVPFAHVNGLVRSMLTSLLGGASLFPVRSFIPRTMLHLIDRERLTFFGGVPPMFGLLTEAGRRAPADLSNLRVVFSSSAPLAPDDNERFYRVHGFHVRQLYGCTETGTICYNDAPDLSTHLGSVGRPLPGVTVAIVGEGAERLDPGAEGEVSVASPFAAPGYDGNAAATELAFRGGFYLTGDLGRLDRDGHLVLTGRRSLVINRGGYKVNPYEVETVIRQHPKVVDAVVFGVPAPLGEQVACAVVVREACRPDEIVAHCRERIADYKVPSRIEFRESLPRTAAGKIRRREF